MTLTATDSQYSDSKPVALFNKRWDLLPQDLVKSRSHGIGYDNAHISLKYDMHLGSAAAVMPVKF